MRATPRPPADPILAFPDPAPPPTPGPHPPMVPPDDVLRRDLVAAIDIHMAPGLLALGPAERVPVPASPIASRTTYTSGPAGGYNIQLEFRGLWTVAQQNAFIDAAERLSAVITGDIPTARVAGSSIDDIRISVELAAIDGPGGMLGQSGPTALRLGSFLPATATMRFDSADVLEFQSLGLFDAIVGHELLHAVGVGTIWEQTGLLTDAGFIGPETVAEYGKLVDAYSLVHGGGTALPDGTELTKDTVPVETEGGPGTARAHWSERVFHGELMTGWLDAASFGSGMIADPLSPLTAASLRDLGYTVPLRPPLDLFYLG